MPDDASLQITDPESEDKKEKFSVALMGATSGMIFGLVASAVGLVGGLLSDQNEGLVNVGIGMGIFAVFSLIHLAISVAWLGSTGRDPFQSNLGSFLFASLGGALYFYAAFSDTGWVVTGFIGGLLFLVLLGNGIMGIEQPPPRSRKITYLFSPFERTSLTIVLLVGTMLGIGVGMNSEGHRTIGRGTFARTFLADTIVGSRHEVDILLFGLPKPYRLLEALPKAREKGISVRVLLTREVALKEATNLAGLSRAGISVRILPLRLPSYIHPFVLVDRRILLTGSGGWGSQMEIGGHQMKMTANLLSIGKIRLFQKNFDSVWSESVPAAGAVMTAPGSSVAPPPPPS